MFEQRPLSGELDELRDERAPGTLVFDVERDFETLPSAVAESLLAVVDTVDPTDYNESWVPDGAPDTLHRLAGEVDHDLVTGTDDRLHLTHLLATWARVDA